MRNVVVTGGSRGIGLGIARRLVMAGFHVTAVARKQTDQLTEAIEEAGRDHPGALDFVPFDLADINELKTLVRKVRSQFGPIYGLVNNAAASVEGVLALLDVANIENLVRLNTVSPIVLTKFVVRSMMADGAGGRIVNVASIVASTGHSGLSVYGATKASIVGFTRSLAREVGPIGVNVNAVAPGFVDTEMTQSLDTEQRQRIARRSALRRMADIDDVAKAVEFLLGDGANNITGTVLTVDAGATA